MPKVEPVYWIGEVDTCNMCGQYIKNSFVDGATRQGPWAIMDLRCHRIHGRGVGKGLGQVYRQQEGGRWLKVEG